jgi:uncharacterized protein (DUF305 family)
MSDDLGTGAATGDEGTGLPDDAVPENVAPADVAPAEPGRGRRVLHALSPQGPLQIALAVVAVCFLAGAAGYLIGTRQAPVATGAVDQGFLFDMSDHHDQAVQMALCTVGRVQDETVQKMAAEILVFQNRELARMASLLELMQVERPPTEGRTSMGWMGMPVPVDQMPGMASPADLDALCKATGSDLDKKFLTLMRAHHQGGVHMAEAAAADAANPSVRKLAEVMAHNQRIEVNEYTAQMARLGLNR